MDLSTINLILLVTAACIAVSIIAMSLRRQAGEKRLRAAVDSYLPGWLSGLNGSNYSIALLVERMARHRGHPIEVKAVRLDTKRLGAWIATPQTDYILVEAHTPPIHQGGILLRQLARMLLNRPTLTVDDAAPFLARPETLALVTPPEVAQILQLEQDIAQVLLNQIGAEAIVNDKSLKGLLMR